MFKLFQKKIKPKNMSEELIVALYGNPPPKAQRADCSLAINLAYTELLGEVVERSEVEKHAQKLFSGPIPYTTHDLALSTAIWFYKSGEYTSDLASEQLMARMTVLEWFQAGKVGPLLVKAFEDDLYALYK
jgi:hypothetical protein